MDVIQWSIVLLFADLIPCRLDGKFYQPGEVVKADNCTKECKCGEDGSMYCKALECPEALYRKGNWYHDVSKFNDSTSDFDRLVGWKWIPFLVESNWCGRKFCPLISPWGTAEWDGPPEERNDRIVYKNAPQFQAQLIRFDYSVSDLSRNFLGQFSDDPLCEEIPSSGGNECCVSVFCSQVTEAEDDSSSGDGDRRLDSQEELLQDEFVVDDLTNEEGSGRQFRTNLEILQVRNIVDHWSLQPAISIY